MTTNILAPFVKLDESFQFYVSGRLFEMNDTEIKEIERTSSSTLINAINAFEAFQFTEDSVRWFHGPSKFIYNLAEGIFQHNNSEIIGNSFSNHIMAAGHIRYGEKPLAELFESLPTLLENYATLDFAATFEGNETTVNLFKLNEDLYVARFNKSNKIAKFFKAKSANEAASYVTAETGESALLFLKEMVEGESAELAIKEEKLQTYESMLSFLKDQKGLLANADRNDEAIKEAESLINGEIKVWEDKIAQLDESSNDKWKTIRHYFPNPEKPHAFVQDKVTASGQKVNFTDLIDDIVKELNIKDSDVKLVTSVIKNYIKDFAPQWKYLVKF